MRFLWVLLILVATSSWAHQSSLSSGGNELFWSNPNVPITIRTNTSDMSSTDVRTIIQNSMAQWNNSASARITEGSSQNEIRFVSNFPYGSAVLGVTELTYNSSGAVQRAVISLNDDYDFQANPGLYSAGQVYLGDVVTHEMGHLFGLSHSEVLNSSMFYSAYSGQSTVALDDRSGIRQKYDSSFGSIIGYTKGGSSHIGVLGVHVQAISRKTGEVSGAISDETGYFKLGGLDLDDTYYLYTSPVKNVDSLPGYFSNVQTEFCPASYVGSFFSACGRENDGKPQGITLTALNPAVDVGEVSIHCALKSDEDYSVQKLQSSFSPVTIFDYADEPKNEKAFVGWFRASAVNSWSAADVLNIDLTNFTNVGGYPKYVKISLVSFPLGSQLEYQMSVKKNGVTQPSAARALSYSSATETYNPDFEAFLPLDATLSNNHFEVSLKSKRLSNTYAAQTFPSYIQFASDQYLPYLIIASLWENTGTQLRPLLDTGVLLSDNYACLDAPFTYAVSKARNVNDDSSLTGSAGATAAGCGTIDPPDGGPGSSLPLIALGFMLMLLPSLLSKSRKKFLS